MRTQRKLQNIRDLGMLYRVETGLEASAADVETKGGNSSRREEHRGTTPRLGTKQKLEAHYELGADQRLGATRCSI